MENGFQVAFMAPTEILAEQHFLTIRGWLERSRFAWRCSPADAAKKRREAPGRSLRGEMHLVVGTHALVQDPVGSARWGWSSSTSSTASAWCSARRWRSKGLHPTCW
jgi:ATP-dependent DNA helicase RecG